VLAFIAWTGSPGQPLADLLAEQGALRPEHRPLLEGLADAHLKLHGGDPDQSLAALDLNRSTRESLAHAGGADVEATLAHVGSGSGSNGDADHRTAGRGVTATSEHPHRAQLARRNLNANNAGMDVTTALWFCHRSGVSVAELLIFQ
jgi:hypothetical protein